MIATLLGYSRYNFNPLLGAISSSSAAEVRPNRSNFRFYLRHVRILLLNRLRWISEKGVVESGRHATGGGAVVCEKTFMSQ